MLLTELAAAIDADIIYPHGESVPSLSVSRISPITEAKSGEITFIANPEYARHLSSTKASAVIIAAPVADCAIPQVVHRNPYWAFAKVAQLFYQPPKGFRGISPNAAIAHDVLLGKDVTIYPFCYVGNNVRIGNRVTLHAGVSIGDGSQLGDDVTVYPNAVIYHETQIGNRVIVHSGAVIGADGFGFAPGEGEIVKIPQIGHVKIEDDVEIGAVTTIDRAAMGVTLIKRGTKLDSKVHIAHNVEVGEGCMFSALTGIAGSTKIGKGVLMGGHSGAIGHITLADKTKVGAMTGIVKDTEPGETYMGFPGIPAKQWRRQQVYMARMAEYDKRLRDLEKRLKAGDDSDQING